MRTNINQPIRRASTGLLACMAVLSLALATAAISPATAGALPVEGGGAKKCTPGDIKTVNGKKYVCNKSGKWVHVLNLVATSGGNVAPGTTTANTVIAKENGGGGQVTCGSSGTPGDTMTMKQYRNGKLFRTVSYVCGKDGQWHQVARIGPTGGSTSGIVATGQTTAYGVIAKDKGSGSQQVTCGDGSKPGDTDTHKFYLNGKLNVTITFICGKDGQMHIVARRSTGPTHPPVPPHRLASRAAL